MVRTAKKAPKGDDSFAQRKQKVGRKKLAPATATRAEVHARTLRINNAVAVEKDVNEVDSGVIPHRSFTENVTASNHYRSNVRSGALGSLGAQVLEEGKKLSPVHRLQALTVALTGIADTDRIVRDRAVVLVQHVMKFSDPDEQTMASILQYTHIALTHAVYDVRKTGVEVIGSVMNSWPGKLRHATGSRDSAAQILERVYEISTASQFPHLGTFASLLEELLVTFDTSSFQTSDPFLCSAMDAFFDASGQSLLLRWKEFMEMRYTLFRDAVATQRACAVARAIACIGVYLKIHGRLTKSHIRLLRDVFVFRVAFTMHDLCSGNNPRSIELASWVAAGCALLLQSSCDEAQRSIQVFLTASFSNAPLATSLRIMFLVVTLAPNMKHKYCSLLPPLLHAVTRAVGGQSCTVDSVQVSATLLSEFFNIRQPSLETLQHLGASLLLVCRVLFSCRRLDGDGARRIAKEYLSLVWTVVSTRHPVLAHIDVASFADTLQSIFGVASTNGAVTAPGILDAAASGEISALGAHIFHYLGRRPYSVHAELPCGMPPVVVYEATPVR